MHWADIAIQIPVNNLIIYKTIRVAVFHFPNLGSLVFKLLKFFVDVFDMVVMCLLWYLRVKQELIQFPVLNLLILLRWIFQLHLQWLKDIIHDCLFRVKCILVIDWLPHFQDYPQILFMCYLLRHREPLCTLGALYGLKHLMQKLGSLHQLGMPRSSSELIDMFG